MGHLSHQDTIHTTTHTTTPHHHTIMSNIDQTTFVAENTLAQSYALLRTIKRAVSRPQTKAYQSAVLRRRAICLMAQADTLRDLLEGQEDEQARLAMGMIGAAWCAAYHIDEIAGDLDRGGVDLLERFLAQAIQFGQDMNL